MAQTKIIRDAVDFQLSPKWKEVSRQENKIVDQNGDVVGTGYAGQRFKVVCNAKLSDTAFQKRRTKAFLAIIFSFGLAYCCSNWVKGYLAQKHRLFIVPEAPQVAEIAVEQLQGAVREIQESKIEILLSKEVTLEEAEKALNNSLVVPLDVLEQIETGKNIQIISKGQFFTTFSVSEVPNLIFKIATQGNIEKRYQNTVKGKQAIMKWGLDHLKVPDTILIKTPNKTILAEERLPINAGNYFQEDLYYQHQAKLKPIALQLSRLICQTGDDDVRASNYPLFEVDGELKCGVIDLEWLGGNPVDGFMGGKHDSLGLIGMMPNEELIDTVIEEGKKLGLNLVKKGFMGMEVKASSKKSAQLWEIERYLKYLKFLEKFQTGLEPIMDFSEIETLGLDLEESWQYKDEQWNATTDKCESVALSVSLGEAVQDVVDYINGELMSQKDDDRHIKSKRSVQLPMNQKPYTIYENLGLPPEKLNLTSEDEKMLWMPRILNALRTNGYIFEYKHLGGGHGYKIHC